MNETKFNYIIKLYKDNYYINYKLIMRQKISFKNKKDYTQEEEEEENQNQENKDKELEKVVYNSEDFLKIFFKSFNYFFTIIYKSIKFIIKVAGIYLLWILLHYLSSHLYVKLCVPSTIIGFMMSPFMTATPHCQGLRWIVYNAANMINNMWIVLGTWICSTILIINRENVLDNSS